MVFEKVRLTVVKPSMLEKTMVKIVILRVVIAHPYFAIQIKKIIHKPYSNMPLNIPHS
jgi:hypothetical protein